MERYGLFLMACAVLTLAGSANAAYTEMGNSGWAMIVSRGMQPVEVPTFYGIQNDAVTIGLHKTFNRPMDELGYFNPIVIEFMKISENAVSQINISHEYITNLTGTEWQSFNMQLVVDMLNPQAGFNPIPVDGDQLEDVSYSNNIGYNGQPIFLNFDNAIGAGVPFAPPGEDVFMPGLIVGSIQINVDPSLAVSSRFGLKELPFAATTPEPATILVLGMGALAVLRKKSKLS